MSPSVAASIASRPDSHGGIAPKAVLRDVIAWCRDHLAHFKVPRRVVFQPLPKTSTGKIQKTVLRDEARSLDCVLPGTRFLEERIQIEARQTDQP